MDDDVTARLTAAERQRLAALLADEPVRRIMRALGADNVRIVGGAVRNALLDEPVHDVDFATVLLPHEVMRRLRAAGFSMHPVGIAHGTVLAAADGRGFEITTLRRDVRTDGRHAEVAFTDDWAEDARRRDFTMNALYLDAQGRLHDPVGGLRDVRARRLRFIGDAARRIAEDYLRILRYFRFLARYGAGQPEDAATLATIARCRAGLRRISRERVRAEMRHLLQADGAARALELMRRTGVAALLFPDDCAWDMTALRRMLEQDAALGLPADWLLRLLALCGLHESLRPALKLSRAEVKRLRALRALLAPPEKEDADKEDAAAGEDASPQGGLPAARDAAGWRRLAYLHGASLARDVARLAAATGTLDPAALAAMLEVIETFRPPDFPLRGQDVIDAGVAPGAAVGEVLRRVRARWLADDFRPAGRNALLALLRAVLREMEQEMARDDTEAMRPAAGREGERRQGGKQ